MIVMMTTNLTIKATIVIMMMMLTMTIIVHFFL